MASEKWAWSNVRFIRSWWSWWRDLSSCARYISAWRRSASKKKWCFCQNFEFPGKLFSGGWAVIWLGDVTMSVTSRCHCRLTIVQVSLQICPRVPGFHIFDSVSCVSQCGVTSVTKLLFPGYKFFSGRSWFCQKIFFFTFSCFFGGREWLCNGTSTISNETVLKAILITKFNVDQLSISKLMRLPTNHQQRIIEQ